MYGHLGVFQSSHFIAVLCTVVNICIGEAFRARQMQAYSTYPSSTVFQRNRPISFPTLQTPTGQKCRLFSTSTSSPTLATVLFFTRQTYFFSLPGIHHGLWCHVCISLDFPPVAGNCKSNRLYQLVFLWCFIPELWWNLVEQLHRLPSESFALFSWSICAFLWARHPVLITIMLW